MTRRILAAIAAVLAWFVVATVLDHALRLAWPAYAAALPAYAFSAGMLAARLIEGAASTLAAGAVAAWVKEGRGAFLGAGVLLLVVFVPGHVRIWERFPLWYHLVFLTSLVPLTWVGGRVVQTSPRSPHRDTDPR